MAKRNPTNKPKVGKYIRTPEVRAKISASLKVYYENGGENPWKNKKLSAEHRQKLSDSHKGKKLTEAQNKALHAKPVWNKGIKMSEDFRRKMSISAKGRVPWNKGLKGFRGGSAHHRWRGGVTPESERIRRSLDYKEWRKVVFTRDDYTCQICRIRGGNLHADHIQPFCAYPELRFDVTNGRTLCKDCHKTTPTYGYGATKIMNELEITRAQ